MDGGELPGSQARPGQVRAEQRMERSATQHTAKLRRCQPWMACQARGWGRQENGVTAKLVLLEADSRVKFGWPEPGLPATLPALPASGALIDPDHPMTMRQDKAENTFRRDELLKNAPQVQAGCVVVPRIVE